MKIDVPRLPLDVLRQNHTLIAGTTGSGKSVFLDGVFFAIATQSPRTVQAVTIDLKRVELSRFADLPHVLDGATEPAQAARILRTVNALMDGRYKQMEREKRRKSADPHLYLIVDELADLLQTVPAALDYLTRIARLGRAANVHIIGATQSPDRKTLSAQLCQNITARAALRCRDKIESRQIIGAPGAELLPRWGECLYFTPDLLQPERVPVTMIQPEQWDALRRFYGLPPLPRE